MEPLSAIRNKWPEVEAEETRLLREMTIAQSLKEFAMLYDAYADHLQSDDFSAWPEREAALIERQQRLVRLAQWLKAHPDQKT